MSQVLKNRISPSNVHWKLLISILELCKFNSVEGQLARITFLAIFYEHMRLPTIIANVTGILPSIRRTLSGTWLKVCRPTWNREQSIKRKRRDGFAFSSEIIYSIL